MIQNTGRDQLDHTLLQVRQANLAREDVDAVLEELAERLGIDTLALDENNATELIVDDEIALYLVYLNHLPGLIAAIPMPPGVADSPELLASLLRTNMFWDQTHGGTFGMVPGLEEPMLCRLIVLTERDAEKLDQELATFVELGKTWREELASRGDQQPVSSAMPMRETPV